MKPIHKNKDIWKKENHKLYGYKAEEPQIGGEAKLSQYNNNLDLYLFQCYTNMK